MSRTMNSRYRLVNRSAIVLLIWLFAGLGLIALAEAFAATIGAQGKQVLNAIGGTFVGVAATIIFGYIVKDSIKEYIGEILEVILSDPNLIARLDEESQRKIVGSVMRARIPWCAEALSAMIESARSHPHARMKRNPRYAWALEDVAVPVTAQHNNQIATFQPSDYFRVRVEDDVAQDPSIFAHEARAVFLIENQGPSGEDLARQFREKGVLYRDFLTLTPSNTSELLKLCQSMCQGGRVRVPVSGNPFGGLVTFRLHVTVQEGADEVEHVVEPPEIEVFATGLSFVFRKDQFDFMRSSLVAQGDVRVSMRASLLIDRDAGSYPIILSSFSYDPEIRVQFATTALERRSWTSFLVLSDPHLVSVREDTGGFTVHTRRRLGGEPRWVFPGSGITIRWRER